MITPIYRDLSRKLQDYIVENNLTGRLPGLVPLCREFGVHQATMTKAIHLLRDRGLLRIEGTRGTFVVRDDRPRQTYHIIGLIGFNHLVIRDSVLDSLNPVVEKAGYQLLSMSFHPSLYLKNRDIFAQFPVDGLIFCYSSLTREVAEHLRRENIPLVCCNRRPDLPWLNTVDYDHRREFRAAFSYLRKLGHRRIAMLEYEREADYQCHLELVRNIFADESGSGYEPELFYVTDLPESIRKQTGQERVTRFVRAAIHHFFSLDAPPTAILCPMWAAEELSKQLKQQGFQIPKDISIITLASNYGHQPLFTSLVHDENKLLKTAIQRMFGLLSGEKDRGEQLTVQGQLKPGTTTAKAPELYKSTNYKQEAIV